jgi:hypothetical protein
MHLITLSQIVKFGESQTGTQRQKRWLMPSRHLNRETGHCRIKLISISSRTVEKGIARKGGRYE